MRCVLVGDFCSLRAELRDFPANRAVPRLNARPSAAYRDKLALTPFRNTDKRETGQHQLSVDARNGLPEPKRGPENRLFESVRNTITRCEHKR